MVESNDLQNGLERLKSLASEQCYSELLQCCGSSTWANRMVTEQPFSSPSVLIATGERIWWSLEEKDWLEAFRSHPKIGERKAEQQTSAEAQQWSEQEQSGVQSAAGETRATLANLNSEYETKFGFIFIICATGKSSEEMLSALRDRLKNEPEKELRIAAAEQAKITSLRLEKLLRQ